MHCVTHHASKRPHREPACARTPNRPVTVVDHCQHSPRRPVGYLDFLDPPSAGKAISTYSGWKGWGMMGLVLRPSQPAPGSYPVKREREGMLPTKRAVCLHLHSMMRRYLTVRSLPWSSLPSMFHVPFVLRWTSLLCGVQSKAPAASYAGPCCIILQCL